MSSESHNHQAASAVPGSAGEGTGPSEHYAARAAELRAEIASADARSGHLSRWRLVSFTGLVVSIGLGIWRGWPPLGWAAVGLLGAVFLALVVRHALLMSAKTQVEQRLRIVDAGLLRLKEEPVVGVEDGSRFSTPNHPYANDLDIFGPASAFARMNATQTGPGEARLAAWLRAPALPEEIRERQDASRDLVRRRAFREDLGTLGLRAEARGRDEEPLLAWAEAPSLFAPAPHLPGGFARTAAPAGLLRGSRWLVPITLGLVAAGPWLAGFAAPAANAWLAGALLHLGVLLWTRPSIAPFIAQATSREAPFGRYRAMLERIEREGFTPETTDSALLRRLGESTRGAAAELASLERIAGFADLRHNTLIHLVADLFLLYDVWCALALERWRHRAGGQARAWIEAIGTLEALSSLATFADEHPRFAWPELSESIELEAIDVGHPLVPSDKRVGNDVHLTGKTRALLVTGSNMSGKSTLLRSLGLNTVLAMAGSVVCARSMRLAPLRVRTSMRISDDLDRGVSHFYAEVARLKDIVDEVDLGRPVLFLLDEILHGTNSRERHLGARAVILGLLDKGAIGAASSHDLALADLAEKSGGRLDNVHFEEHVEDEGRGTMTFDYQLRPGVVRTQNALRLMRLVGLDVPLEQGPPEVESARPAGRPSAS